VRLLDVSHELLGPGLERLLLEAVDEEPQRVQRLARVVAGGRDEA
jgi:hypothetical protein